jgi:hypothetical protein
MLFFIGTFASSHITPLHNIIKVQNVSSYARYSSPSDCTRRIRFDKGWPHRKRCINERARGCGLTMAAPQCHRVPLFLETGNNSLRGSAVNKAICPGGLTMRGTPPPPLSQERNRSCAHFRNTADKKLTARVRNLILF